MFKQKIKSFILILLSSLLISACDTKSSNKIIEYQEEVKLSDGSFIWVDIKRHYGWSGWAPGGGSGAYLPGIVEISWDTGFPNVGRQSVFFDGGVVLLDKVDGVWYVVGGKPSFNGAYQDSKAVNCRDVGVFINNGYTCVYVLDTENNARKATLIDNIVKATKVNILTLDGLYDWEHNSGELDNAKLYWSDKLNLNDSIQDGNRRSLTKLYAEY